MYQMRAIKEELGDNDDDEDDVAALERKMQDASMPANIWKHAQRELRYKIGRIVNCKISIIYMLEIFLLFIYL